ncbi:MAG: carbonic anhydrase [Acidimicrobiales bacterium]
MDRLLRGIAQFQAEIFPQMAERYAELASGQSPEVFFITCSDSRIDPSLLTQQPPGELFVTRNAGNIVPSANNQDLNPDGLAAALEYAVHVLDIKHIVVCGHSDCGAMKGALHPEVLEGSAYIRTWIEHCSAAVESRDDDLDEVIRRNVLLQLERLETYSFVAERVRNETLKLHGWVYDIGSGSVAIHDGESWN